MTDMDVTETETNTDVIESTQTHDHHDTTNDKDQGVLYLGIDLGTSRTSVTASNGERVTIASWVGYPKDVVSRKLLGKDVLYGDEALEKRLSLNLYRPLAQGVLKYNEDGEEDYDGNLKAAKDLIRQAIRQAKPRKDELVYAVIGCPAEASIHNREAILEAARESVDSVMLCSEPFSVAYGLDMLDDVLVIDIGAGTTDLCRMHGTMPEEADQVTLTYAGDFDRQGALRLLLENYPEAQFTIQMVKSIKERSARSASQLDACVVEPAGQRQAHRVRHHRTRCAMACQTIVGPDRRGPRRAGRDLRPRVPEQAEGPRAARRRRQPDQGPRHRHRGARCTSILGGGKVIRIEEPMYGGANGALKIAHDMPARVLGAAQVAGPGPARRPDLVIEGDPRSAEAGRGSLAVGEAAPRRGAPPAPGEPLASGAARRSRDPSREPWERFQGPPPTTERAIRFPCRVRSGPLAAPRPPGTVPGPLPRTRHSPRGAGTEVRGRRAEARRNVRYPGLTPPGSPSGRRISEIGANTRAESERPCSYHHAAGPPSP